METRLGSLQGAGREAGFEESGAKSPANASPLICMTGAGWGCPSSQEPQCAVISQWLKGPVPLGPHPLPHSPLKHTYHNIQSPAANHTVSGSQKIKDASEAMAENPPEGLSSKWLRFFPQARLTSSACPLWGL